MAKRRASSRLQRATHLRASYARVVTDIAALLDSARQASVRSVNAIMTATYWEVGRRIVHYEQQGADRAEYGEELLARLSKDLSQRFGRGFGRRNLYQMRQFYLVNSEIVQTPSAQSGQRARTRKLQTLSAQSERSDGATLAKIAAHFRLPWSHYVRLLSVEDAAARRFYEEESLHGGWSVRQLDRQIGSQFYERTALSRNKSLVLAKGRKPSPADLLTVEDQIKDPLVLEFLDLKDEYSETDLEEAIVRRIESFLLELGSDFTFVGRQKRLRVGNQWFRIDLLFFHRRLRCLVIIDLKLAPFTPSDAGQMNLYLNYAQEHWTREDENPPVGLILCASHSDAVARYALAGLSNKVMAGSYRTILPSEARLQAEIDRTRREFERRRVVAATSPRSRRRETRNRDQP